MPRAKKTPAAAEGAEKQRGRPRPDEVVERDETVFKSVTKEPQSIAELVTATGIQRSHVYLSLYRLRRDGKVTRGTLESGNPSRQWLRV